MPLAGDEPVSEAEVKLLIEGVAAAYAPEAQAHGAQFSVRVTGSLTRIEFAADRTWSILVGSDLFRPGLGHTHETDAPLVRLVALDRSLRSPGATFRWQQELAGGLGEPHFAFYAPGFTLVSVAFSRLGFSPVASTRPRALKFPDEAVGSGWRLMTPRPADSVPPVRRAPSSRGVPSTTTLPWAGAAARSFAVDPTPG